MTVEKGSAPDLQAGGPVADELDVLVDARAAEMGIDPALLRSWRELGYVPTAETRDLFPTSEIEAWRDAVDPFDRAGDESSTDGRRYVADLIDLLADDLEDVIARTLADHSAEPARRFTARVVETDLLVALEENDQAGRHETLGVTVAFLILTGWLTRSRAELSGPDTAAEVLGAIRDGLGREFVDVAVPAAGLLAAESSRPTSRKLADDLDDELLPALIWLAAGLVRRYGDGDVTWLRWCDRGDGAAR